MGGCEPIGRVKVAPERRPVVVIVDDDPLVLASAQRLLRHEPWELVVCHRSADALDLIGHREIDVLVAEHHLRDMSGGELLRVARERAPGTARVITTGHIDRATLLEILEAGCMHRIYLKPWNDEQLRASLRELLRRRGWPLPGDEPAGEPEVTLTGAPVSKDALSLIVSCQGLRSTEALMCIRQMIERSDSRACGVRVILEDLPGLTDSPTRFLSQFFEMVYRSGAPVALTDRSGCAEALRMASANAAVAPRAR